MKEYIELKAAVDLAMQYCPDDDGTCSKADKAIRELLDELENLPSIQLDMPLVRCRDCKTYEGDCGWCDYWDGSANFNMLCTQQCNRPYRMDCITDSVGS